MVKLQKQKKLKNKRKQLNSKGLIQTSNIVIYTLTKSSVTADGQAPLLIVAVAKPTMTTMSTSKLSLNRVDWEIGN